MPKPELGQIIIQRQNDKSSWNFYCMVDDICPAQWQKLGAIWSNGQKSIIMHFALFTWNAYLCVYCWYLESTYVCKHYADFVAREIVLVNLCPLAREKCAQRKKLIGLSVQFSWYLYDFTTQMMYFCAFRFLPGHRLPGGLSRVILSIGRRILGNFSCPWAAKNHEFTLGAQHY